MQLTARWSGLALLATMVVVGACDSPTKPPPAVASVVVGPGTALIGSGDSLQLGLIVRDAKGNELTGRPVVWTSSDTTLAKVSATGMVRAKSNRNNNGATVAIVATVSGVSDDAQLIVQPVAAATLTLTPLAGTLGETDAPTVAFVARDAAGDVLTGRQPDWVSRDTSLIRVSMTGIIEVRPFIGASNRSTRVVATLGTARDSVTVTVAPSALASLRIQPRLPYLRLGHSKRLRVIGRTVGGSDIANLNATYSSLDAGVATVTTDGIVTANASTPGSTSLIATFGVNADTVPFVVDACGAAPAGTYPIELRNAGSGMTAAVQEAFNCARARIQAIIRAPISTIVFDSPTNTGANCLNQNIDAGTSTGGVIIYMRVAPIDGVGAVLGRAGPCFVRSNTRLAVVGQMDFDEADIANMVSNGTLLPVILHEMMHVIGIGSTWRDPALAALYTGDVPNPGFKGEQAMRACRDEHGGVLTCAVQVPVEDCIGIPGCGAGTQYGHWRELIFVSELMTGYITPPRPPLSRMTIAALADLGYSVDLEQAEYYVMPSPTLREAGILQPQNLWLGAPSAALVLPTHTVDARGRLRPILR